MLSHFQMKLAHLLFFCLSQFLLIAICKADQVRLHGDDRTSWAARIQSISQAKKEIWIESFYFENDGIGQDLVQKLIRAKKRSPQLDIRVMVDGYGSEAFLENLVCNLQKVNINVKSYKKASAWQRLTQEHSHRKIWLTEKTAIVGGRNLSDENFSGGNRHALWDWDVEIRGKTISQIRNSFLDGWNSSLTEPVDCSNRTPLNLISEIQISPVRMPGWHGADIYWSSDQPGKRETSRAVSHKFLYLIQTAQSKISIENYLFLPVSFIAEAFEQAHDRGVRLEILTNGPMLGYWMGELSGCASMVETEFWMSNGASISITDPMQRTHSKSLLVDDKILAIGSFNLDARSSIWNAESMVTIENSPGLIAEYQLTRQTRLANSHKVKSLEEVFKASRFSAADEQQCRLKMKARGILGRFL